MEGKTEDEGEGREALSPVAFLQQTLDKYSLPGFLDQGLSSPLNQPFWHAPWQFYFMLS